MQKTKKTTLRLAVMGFGVLVAVLGLNVNAETDTIKPVNTRSREEVSEMRKDMMENRAEMKEEMAENRAEMQKEVVSHMAERFDKILAKRMDAALERLNSISSRIETRLTKLEGQGIDVAKAKSLLAEAKVKITKASSDINTLKGEVEKSTYATSTPRDMANKFKTLAETAKESLKSAHKALVLTVESIKPGQNKPGNATSSAKTTN